MVGCLPPRVAHISWEPGKNSQFPSHEKPGKICIFLHITSLKVNFNMPFYQKFIIDFKLIYYWNRWTQIQIENVKEEDLLGLVFLVPFFLEKISCSPISCFLVFLRKMCISRLYCRLGAKILNCNISKIESNHKIFLFWEWNDSGSTTTVTFSRLL